MKIIFEYVNVSSSEHLETLTTEKLQNLQKHYPSIIRGYVFFKLDNKDIGNKKHCGIRLSIAGPLIYESSDKSSFDEAVNETIRDLEDQLEKRKSQIKPYL